MSDHRDDPQTELRAARPLHCVSADGTVKIVRRTGRPKKVLNRPTLDEREYAQQLVRIAERFVLVDPLVQSTIKESARGDPKVIDEVMLQLAQEAASLKFEELKLLRAGRDFGQVSSRRVVALSRIASLVLEREKAGLDQRFDPQNPKVQKVAASFLDSLRECAHETLGPAAEKFLACFDQKVAGWEARVE